MGIAGLLEWLQRCEAIIEQMRGLRGRLMEDLNRLFRYEDPVSPFFERLPPLRYYRILVLDDLGRAQQFVGYRLRVEVGADREGTEQLFLEFVPRGEGTPRPHRVPLCRVRLIEPTSRGGGLVLAPLA